MLTSDFHYELPPELIAQEPSEKRGDDRTLVLDPRSGAMEIRPFEDLPLFLREGDAIVLNNTRVIPARMFARKETGAKIELFFLNPDTESRWICFVRGAKRLKPGMTLRLLDETGAESAHRAVLEEKRPDGTCVVSLPGDPKEAFDDCGRLPLPPYIRRQSEPLDSVRYQTIYAVRKGAVAAPTAGLHFTERTFAALRERGVRRVELTLHVGAGTFKPVQETRIEDHKMHSERYDFSEEAAAELNAVRAAGGRILAVGTTSLRTLESCVDADGVFHAGRGETDIYIHPPYKVRSADMLLTNFHLPESTLLMLVSAFAGMEPIRRAYQFAVAERMRFFSYGDSMLILNKG